jgi:hypothetical protein
MKMKIKIARDIKKNQYFNGMNEKKSDIKNKVGRKRSKLLHI